MSNTASTQLVVVEKTANMLPRNEAEVRYVSLYDEDGHPISSSEQDGSEVLLTGYTSQSADDLAAGDTVNEALAKLEARVAALEDA
jgi:hypothetical protein